MKRKLLFFVIFLITGAFGLTSNAQTTAPTASPIGAGDFYLFNIGKGGYVLGSNDYGTRASISPVDGVYLKLEASGDGYTIKTNNSKPYYLGVDDNLTPFVDREDTPIWIFEPVDGETNVFCAS